MTAAVAVQLYDPLSSYRALENRISKSDWDGLVARWEFGRSLLAERGGAARLPNGRLEELARGLAISRSEIKNRMQFAAQYATEDDVRSAFKIHGSWSAICARGMGARGTMSGDEIHTAGVPMFEMARAADLKPHPRNYRDHPADQLAHIRRSIQEHGLLRVVIVARDNTILGGHGMVIAARELGYAWLPVRRLDYEPNDPRALKILAGDNLIGNVAEDDERAKAEVLKEVMNADDLQGTGFDAHQLRAFVYTCTMRSEIKTVDAAAEWIGMPAYVPQPEPVRLVITFASEEDRARCVEKYKVLVRKKEVRTWSARWPNRPKARPGDLMFVEGDEAAPPRTPRKTTRALTAKPVRQGGRKAKR